MNIEELRKINNQKIEKLNELPDSEDIKKQKIIQNKIKNIIQNDDAIFFKLEMNEALNILNCLVDVSKEELLNIYKEMISKSSFKELQNKFKI